MIKTISFIKILLRSSKYTLNIDQLSIDLFTENLICILNLQVNNKYFAYFKKHFDSQRFANVKNF